jgi:pyroglutamyl-peptidase
VSARGPLTILITGFGPFPGAPVNPTTALIARLARRRHATAAPVRCIGHVFATRYAAVDQELPALIAQHRPDAIVMFGLAARRAHVSIETRARNRISVVFPDAGGGVARRAVIDESAPADRRGRAPMRRLLAAAKGAGIDARLSRDAGRYVCNYIYWRALESAARAGGPRLAVFVHVPEVCRPKSRTSDPRRARARRGYTLPVLVRAGEAILRAVIAAAGQPRTC